MLLTVGFEFNNEEQEVRKERRTYSFSGLVALSRHKCNFSSFVYRLLKSAHPQLSFQSQHVLPPRHPVHRFLVHKHPPVTTHHTLAILICDKSDKSHSSTQIHMFTWQQSPPGRISQWLSVSRKTLVELPAHTKSEWGELSSKSMKWGVTLPSLSFGLYQFC